MTRRKSDNKLDAYKVVTKDNYESIKQIFLESSVAQWTAEQVVERLVAIGLNNSQAWGLVDVEYEGTGFGQMSLRK
jgi:hypothetical protein